MTSSVDIPFGGMDLRGLDGPREVTNFQRDPFGGLVNRAPFLGAALEGWTYAGEELVRLIPPIRPSGALWGGGAYHLVLDRVGASGWELVTIGGVDPQAPAASTSTSVSTTASPTSLAHGYVRYGGHTWFMGGTTLVRVAPDGTPTTSVAPFAADWLGALPWENRVVLVAGDRLQFSNLNDGNTYGTDNWVDVQVGDGERLAGATAWSNYFFAFKQSRFFVFYGTSTDADGEPVFDYRTVAAPGAEEITAGGVAAGERGVYYSSPLGDIRLTTGGPGRPIEPCPSRRHRHLVRHEGFLLALRTGSAAETGGTEDESARWMYVYDESRREWSRWTAGAGTSIMRAASVGGALFLLIRTGTEMDIWWTAPEYNSNNPLTPLSQEDGVSAAYVTGGLDFGTAGLERRVIEAGVVVDENGDDGDVTIAAAASSQRDAAEPDWDTEGMAATGPAPYVRTTGQIGSRHWLRVTTEEGGAARLARLHAVVTDPTDTKYRKES